MGVNIFAMPELKVFIIRECDKEEEHYNEEYMIDP